MNHEKMALAFGRVAWAYVFLYLNVTLFIVNVLPDWAGYLLILSALSLFAEQVPSIILLRPLGRLLAVWAGLVWILETLGTSFDFYILDVLVSILSLYFFFQLLTNLAEVVRQLGFSEEKKLLHLRTIQAVIITVTALPLSWDTNQILITGIVVIHLVVVLWVSVLLFGIKKKLERMPQSTE